MKMRKWFLLILALALVLCLSCVAVSATQQPTLTQSHHEKIPFQVNPAYEGIYDAEDLAPLILAAREEAEESGKVSHQMPTVQTGEGSYLSVEQAGLLLRQKMKERQSYIEVLVSSPNADYNALVEEVVNVATAHTGVPTEGDYLMWHFGGWEGEVDWEVSGGNYLYRFELMMIYYTNNTQEQQLNTAVDNLLNNLALDGKTDYQKIYAIYDYICDNITYDYQHLNDMNYTLKNTAYGALIYKTAVCQGYANLFYRLMLEEGIDCRLIAGEAGGDPHGWNIVKLGDVYYNVDTTWDAGYDTWDYFLQNSEGFADHYRYMDYASAQFHMDYPMSATDYTEGGSGDAENVYVAGQCGANAYWTLGRDRVLTIVGSGKTFDYENTSDLAGRPEWEYWEGTFDTVVVEEGITGLGDYLFIGEDDMQAITLPEGLQTIGKYALQGCVNLEKLQLPGSLTEVGEYAFSGCTALAELEISEDAVMVLGDYAFNSCSSLTEVTVPAGVTGGREVFRYCTGLETVDLYSSDLGEMSFYNCRELSEVNLYDTVEKLRDGFFFCCMDLPSITIPASVTFVDNNAFLDCRSLMEIYFLGDAPTFGTYTFNNLCYNGDVFVYYPCSNETWTQELMETAGSSFGRKEVEWIAGVHNFETTSIVAPDCGNDGYLIKTCTDCGHRAQCAGQEATGLHTYTDSKDDTCNVCGAKREEKVPTTPMYRLYNENSGEHFYTGSVEERDMLVTAGWHYEGVAWNAPTTKGAPVYRLYNPNNGDHHYTMSAEERDMLVTVGWRYEGVAWNSAPATNIPMFRLYNPNADCGSHHYTGSTEERDFLVSLGWHYEGIGWYGMLN